MKFTRFFVAIIIFTSILTSCRQGQENPPVSRQKMGAILLDLQLAEAYSQGLGDSVKNRFEKNTDSLGGFYISVLKHYNIKFTEFEEALQWYKERPMLLDSLYNNVITRLVEIKAQRGITDSEERPLAKDTLPVKEVDTSMHRIDEMKKKDFFADTIRKRIKDTIAHRNKLFKPVTK